jgi:hypothetical protein
VVPASLLAATHAEYLQLADNESAARQDNDREKPNFLQPTITEQADYVQVIDNVEAVTQERQGSTFLHAPDAIEQTELNSYIADIDTPVVTDQSALQDNSVDQPLRVIRSFSLSIIQHSRQA